jgi:hypothetical protein
MRQIDADRLLFDSVETLFNIDSITRDSTLKNKKKVDLIRQETEHFLKSHTGQS